MRILGLVHIQRGHTEDIRSVRNSSIPFEDFEGDWWTFSEYEYRQDRIVAAGTAKLRAYDPWLLHRHSLAGDLNARHPLDDLLAIMGSDVEPIPRVQDVLDWSRKYGPLGILLYRTAEVVMPALSRPEGELESALRTQSELAAATTDKLHSHGMTLSTYQVRFAGRWTYSVWTKHPGVNDETWKAAYSPRVTLRADDLSPAGVGPPPTLGTTWGPYFPHVPQEMREAALYPLPNTAAFARSYCEPFYDWVLWARKLQSAIAQLRMDADDPNWDRGAAELAQLAEPVSLFPVRNPDRSAELKRCSPALLSSLAMMAMQRLAGGASARVCKDPQCRRTFIPANPRAEYDTQRCRWRHLKEAQRASPRTRPKRKRKESAKRKRPQPRRGV